jgi:hypothetical protein
MQREEVAVCELMRDDSRRVVTKAELIKPLL